MSAVGISSIVESLQVELFRVHDEHDQWIRELEDLLEVAQDRVATLTVDLDELRIVARQATAVGEASLSSSTAPLDVGRANEEMEQLRVACLRAEAPRDEALDQLRSFGLPWPRDEESRPR